VERTLGEIARHVGGKLEGDPELRVSALRDLGVAGPADLSFVAHKKYRSLLASSRAGAVLVAEDEPDPGRPCIRARDPYLAFAKALALFHPPVPPCPPGIHPTAVVHPEATLGKDVHVGALCVVESRARIGDRSTVRSGSFVGEGSVLGKGVYLYPNVVVREGVTLGDRVIVQPGAVIGGDGFGFAREGSRHVKIPQVGGIVVGDDVEIGANTTIDRGTLEPTRIGRGTKIDNLVQIAHNVIVGEDAILVSQAGVAGSTQLGDRVVLAAQAGLVGHLHIGDDVVVGAQSGVREDIDAGTIVLGYPAEERARTLRVWAVTARLPELLERVRALEAKIAELEGK
jgi:UDP-3-O-[3-hydroxymyristoyl] glucosamine N-acyltransferase